MTTFSTISGWNRYIVSMTSPLKRPIAQYSWLLESAQQSLLPFSLLWSWLIKKHSSLLLPKQVGGSGRCSVNLFMGVLVSKFKIKKLVLDVFFPLSACGSISIKSSQDDSVTDSGFLQISSIFFLKTQWPYNVRLLVRQKCLQKSLAGFLFIQQA